ncbi:hypothetical protein [Acinetobacter brisouii]|uniref:hypothetical protein n=1 Tax=Acinetobacter brisouii TaxID=396323 RepID=UPI00208E4BBE|nr:hypothetical protein [Acinetobacter brisouii]
MKMPLRTFWLLSNNVERIQAQIDLRTLSLNMQTSMNATEKGVNQLYESLNAETGEIVKMTADSIARIRMNQPRDEEGFAQLKAMI